MNPFVHMKENLIVNGKEYKYYNISKDKRYERLPFSIRVLLESAVRNCDNFQVKEKDVENILSWEQHQSSKNAVEVSFKPARVILQDFTGVPAVVDFAAMRDAVKSLGGEPQNINPQCPADLVIDHSVQVDFIKIESRTNTCEACKKRNTCIRSGNGNYRSSSKAMTLQKPMQRVPTVPVPTATGGGAAPLISRGPALQCPSFHNRPISPPVLQPLELPSVPFTALPLPCLYVPYTICPSQPPHVPWLSSQHEAHLYSQPYAVPLAPLIPPVPAMPPIGTGVAHHVTMPESDCHYFTGDTYVLRPCANVRVQHFGAKHKDDQVSHSSAICRRYCTRKPTFIPDALQKNEELEFERNKERFIFLKWGSQAFKNLLLVPPGSGIVHQVNLEYLARVVFCDDGCLFPDSLVGTDSHTTMINGLGVVGWGVGGIEAEAVMLGQSICMVLPQVVGYKITGQLSPLATSTDVVLTITKNLRQVGVVGKFVEFFGSGVGQLSLADRATVANMCPEYGATIGFFAVDDTTLLYLKQTNRDEEKINLIKSYLQAVKMFRNYSDASKDPIYSEVIELDLGTVVSCVSGPKRPHDRVAVTDMKQDFQTCLDNKIGFKGFSIPNDEQNRSIPFVYEDVEYSINHGSVVIAAITSCTNTSNPSVMLGAGLIAKNAVEAGLKVAPYIKTSLSPGSGVVTHYLQHSGVIPFLEALGFSIVGFGCMTCIGNSGPLPEAVGEAIQKGDLVCCGVLSGNRNFEGRIHPLTRANYLASPLLVIAYALAGTVNIDFELEPIGYGTDGKAVYLRDIWPSRSAIQQVEREHVLPAMFSTVYKHITTGNESWNKLEEPKGQLYPWDDASTYIKNPPFFTGMTKECDPIESIKDAYVLLNLGDSVTTDHISPAGSIARNSPAARYLASFGLTPREFNSYGARRGNDAVMVRGTFANIRLFNKLIGKTASRTIHLPSGEQMDIFDAAQRYSLEKHPVIILAGKEYGSGSSRDWAAKGPYLLGVKAVIAESYERIHRSNLVGMGIIPLQFLEGQTAATLGLQGTEKFSIELPQQLQPGMIINVSVSDGKTFEVHLRFDTEVELVYFQHGGILKYMVRKICA